MNDINRKRYVIPPLWDTKETVAASLQCDPSRVADILKPGILSGDIECQTFAVWDDNRRMVVRVTCYRLATGEPTPVPDLPIEEKRVERIRNAILRLPAASDSVVARSLYKVKRDEVAAVRAAMRA